MSDFASLHRRQPPSPLVFAPESVLPQPISQSNSSTYGSGSNTVSMPFVRRHVTRRLKTAKADCDKELRRVINNITAFFEERLRDGGDQERDIDRDYRDRDRDFDRDSQYGDAEPLREAFVYHSFDPRPASQADTYSDSGYDLEQESHHHTRQRAFPEDDSTKLPSLTHRVSSPGLLVASNSSLSPSLRRQPTLPREKPVSTPPSSIAVPSPIVASATLADVANPRRQSNAMPPTAWPAQSISSRRLSRSVHIPIRPVKSGQSSRSTSRSRSPLPPATTHSSFSDVVPPPSSVNRRSSRILLDEPIDPIMTALYDLIGVATDVAEMSTAQLTAQPKVCESLVQRVQTIGKAWDDHPDWHGRNWYVQVLLAVASLSRVVEWWEAEKQFWNFDDNEDEQDEPLMFVLKPPDEHPPAPTPTARSRQDELRFTAEDESRLRLTRPMSQGRRSRDEVPKDISFSSVSPEQPVRKAVEHNESARVLATERLRLQAETAQNQNIVLELSLDGDHFIWVNYAWRVVVGTEPSELPGTRISHLLAPADCGVFRDATYQLQQDDSHTVEVRFGLQVEPEGDHDASLSGVLYQQMEGKGMLMIDREDAQPSHTMWVVKPVGSPRWDYPSPSIVLESDEVGEEPVVEEPPKEPLASRIGLEPLTPFPFTQPISTEPILCRICECHIPQWYFEKHSETCVEVHRLEAEIVECNESVGELKNTIRDIMAAMDIPSPASPPEYRGVPIFTHTSSPSMPSPLQLFRRDKMQRLSVKKAQRRMLESLDEILQVASEISMPSLKEEESKEPIERQRLLSPGSERKMSQIRTWCRPPVEDAALSQLAEDVERIMRQKVDNVVRMQNTIKYSEKIWHEWEEKVTESLAIVEAGESSESEEEDYNDGVDSLTLPIPEDVEAPVDGDRPTNQSEELLSSEPTPMASVSPMLIATPSASRVAVSAPVAQHVPPMWQIISKMPTRSSTPSSISSPLALAAPITASPSLDDQPPYMDLNDTTLPENATVRTRRSASNLLEPRLLVTPPMSPSISPRDAPVTRRGHRRHSTVNPILSPTVSSVPLSPRQSSTAPLSRSTPTSIKDFDIIKPISKGAFGSVFLAKKKVTGDYYAIKVLKKADMIAKNQITNVKAERMILMKQAESPFVAKLYFTFQSKENLYLVMEYLNGGDCAALIKSLGSLPEEWTKQYIAEVVLGLEYLHQRGVVHRDLKPDNLLIDQHGHLKLTDFGLSRIGLLGRQTREPMGMGLRHRTRYDSRSRPPSIDSGFLSSPLLSTELIGGGSYFSQGTHPVPRQGISPYQLSTDDASESGSESLYNHHSRRSRAGESPLQSFATELTTDLRSYSGGHTPPGEQKFVGTPDYLAPETILGLRGDDAAVDWWALGVITYEFLYGIPPFHAETPEKVFENILSGHIEWHEDWVEFSDEARDLMQRLMCIDPSVRLGASGADEVKEHPFFEGIEWDKVTSTEAAFIPQVSDPESTDYFDPRGAIPQLFHEEDIAISNPMDSPSLTLPPPAQPISLLGSRDPAPSPASDDFGSFSFKNLPVLKQANDDVIRKLKTDQLAPMTHTLSDPVGSHSRRKSTSQRFKKPPSVVTALDQKSFTQGPPSPSTSTSSIASSPSRASIPPSTPGSSSGSHARKPSEFGALERFKLNHLDGVERRNTMPSRLRKASVSSSVGDGSGSDHWPSSAGQSSSQFDTPPSSVHSIDLKKGPDPTDRAVTCLLAEDNPITAKILETLLIRLGCRVVVVADGSEAMSVAMGDIKFDCILMDLHMPVVDGEGAARYIKTTNGKNSNTPIVAVSAYSTADSNDSSLFTASLTKPVQRADLLAVMRRLGFKTSAIQGLSTKVTASRVS
ncbi:RIM15, signal transduction response regulator [Suillus paluster]|uniref:RIM15, signal transduction response regulator n=1 Tax=Suillus paluster TaxID=48578 RepID=UPI001B8782F8|nr:RIM15, signal transduction response regulator [Suillus paluster]KAG1752641.1 RIM15, signal transduction response regulator [Suillus paluster]